MQFQYQDLLFNRLLCGWVIKTVRILIQWWLLFRVQIALEATLFFVDLCWKRKTWKDIILTDYKKVITNACDGDIGN